MSLEGEIYDTIIEGHDDGPDVGENDGQEKETDDTEHHKSEVVSMECQDCLKW